MKKLHFLSFISVALLFYTSAFALEFSPYQAIPTKSARAVESFEIDGTSYLAIANGGDGTTDNVDSGIYKWNGSSFVEIQSIPTHRAWDWENFSIEGDTYLAVANYANGVTYSLNSKIYKWNGTSFVEFQSIPTIGGNDMEPFVIDGETYLAVSNSNPYSGQNSKIYKWNGSSFVEFQSVVTYQSTNWESFQINGETYLTVTNGRDSPTNFYVDSKVYKWNGSSFAEVQAIPTIRGYDSEAFSIDGVTYLAIANRQSDFDTFDIDSKIYQWNGASFVEFQTIASMGAMDWEAFAWGGETYLALANFFDGTSYVLDSKIYRWNGASFEEEQSLMTKGADDWNSFYIEGDLYLAVANRYDDTSHCIDSIIYKAEPVPEPATMLLLGSGLIGLAGFRKRFRK